MHPKTSCKFLETIKQTEKVSQVSGVDKYFASPLYSETKKWNIFWRKKDYKNAKITKWPHAYASTYSIKTLNSFNSELQLKDAEFAIKNWLIGLLSELIGFKFVRAMVLELKKIESDNETKYNTFYSNSNAELVINKSEIDDVFESIYIRIISNIQKYLGKGSSLLIDSVIDHTISISKYNPLAGSSYTKLPSRKRVDWYSKYWW